MTKTAVILATGPSLTPEISEAIHWIQAEKDWALFGMNHTWIDFDLDYFLSCNYQYYDEFWDKGLKDTRSSKWTWDKACADKYKINHIEGKWADGFSKTHLHLGHSSGFQLPGLAYYLGFERLLLCGYDMKYADDYDGKNKRIGSTPRHYFGEYPEKLQHWPSVKVKNGVFTELIEQFEKVKELNPDVEIINCSPGSAMTCFPIKDIRECV